jgi:hypothetical protein
MNSIDYSFSNTWYVGKVSRVLNRPVLTNIKRYGVTLINDMDGAALAQYVTYAQLKEYVGISSCEISNHHIGIRQIIYDIGGDIARHPANIGALHLIACSLGSWFQDALVDTHEVALLGVVITAK